jgi:hypothetical protein
MNLKSSRRVAAAALAAISFAVTGESNGSALVYELRFVSGATGSDIGQTDPAHVRTPLAGTYSAALFAKVTGNDNDDLYDGMAFSYLTVRSSESGAGAFGNSGSSGITSASRFPGTPYMPPGATVPLIIGGFTDAGSRNGSSAHLNADGTRDWGSNSTDLTDSAYMLARRFPPVFGDAYLDDPVIDRDFDGLPDPGKDGSPEPGAGSPIPGGREYRMATFNITITAADASGVFTGSTAFKVVKPPAINNGGVEAIYATYWPDSFYFPDQNLVNIDATNAAAVYDNSIAVMFKNVPEPGIVGLLAPIALGLCRRSRR